MKDIEQEWRVVARLITAEKEAALKELRCRPLAPLPPDAAPAPRRLRLVLLPAAASLLLVAGLAVLWLLRGSWQHTSLAPAAGEILADSFLYAASAQGEAAAGQEAQDAASPYFTALAEIALRAQVQRQAAPGAETASPVALERGDPEEVRRRIGRAIRKGALEQWLANLKEFQDEEA